MSSAHSQFIKWSFPAFALIIGLFWYKRRRVDRADPGGISTSNALETVNKININSLKKNIDLSDSGIKANDSYSSLHTQSIKEPISNLKQISEQQENVSIMMPPVLSGFLPMENSNEISMKNQSTWHQGHENMSITYVNDRLRGMHLTEYPLDHNCQMVAQTLGGDIYNNNVSNNNVSNNNQMKQQEFVHMLPQIENNNAQLMLSSSTNERNEINDAPNNNEQKEEQIQNNPIEEENKPQTQSYPIEEECKTETQGYPIEEESKTQTQALPERDSAINSPISGVTEGNVSDEAGSEKSTDSGKGGSIKEKMKNSSQIVFLYEFSIHNDLVGKLIGHQGYFLKHIRSRSDVYIVVRSHPMSQDDKICSIQGTHEGISIALSIIRGKFPEKKYPNLTLEQIVPVVMQEQIIPIVPTIQQLALIEGINNDVSVCYVMRPDKFFVHIPTHPTHHLLRFLDTNMTLLYNSSLPPVAEVINKGMILVAPMDECNKWVRICVVDPDPEGKATLVRLVDHGGYRTYANSELKQIRSDFLFLPFQAIEVCLANVIPKYGKWHPEAMVAVGKTVSGHFGLAQIVDYVNSEIYVDLYLNIPRYGTISLAEELIARNFADPVFKCPTVNENTNVTEVTS